VGVLVPADAQWRLLGGSDTVVLERQVPADAPAVPFWRVVLASRPAARWNVSLAAESKGAVAQGDALVFDFHVRCPSSSDAETGRGSLSFCLQDEKSDNYKKAAEWTMRVGREWRHVRVGAYAERAVAAGAGRVYFFLGERRQTIELAGMQVINLGAGVPQDKLPVLRVTYGGAAADAPWRAAAAARIERHRKADLEVRVTDSAGKPVAGVPVRAIMRRHAFPFGTAVAAPMLNDAAVARMQGTSAEDVARYRAAVTNLFNCAVLENHLKPTHFRAPGGNADAVAALRWLRGAGLRVRGHTAVWPGKDYSPRDWLACVSDPPSATPPEQRERLRRLIEDHIRFAVGTTASDCFQWDVLNEPYVNRVFMACLGDGVMADWFRVAKSVAPGTRLFVNDYGIVEDPKHAEGYARIIRGLLDAGAPLEGIGEQGHYAFQPPDIELVFAMVDRLGAFGLPVVCTEYDFDTRDEALQAAFTRDYMTALFSRPEIGGFLMWGFWAKRHWRPDCALYAEDWREKPVLAAYRELVTRTWWTPPVSGVTDAVGRFRVRGFQGDYDVAVTRGGRTAVAQVVLPAAGRVVDIRSE